MADTPRIAYRLEGRYREALRRLAQELATEGQVSAPRNRPPSEAEAIRWLVTEEYLRRGWPLPPEPECISEQ